MSEPGGLTSGTESLEGPAKNDVLDLTGRSTEDELIGPDRSLEHSALYVIIFLIVAVGAVVLGRPSEVTTVTNESVHTLMESI